MTAQTAGTVGKVLPAGFLTHENTTAEAKVADPVLLGDLLRTSEQGRMRVDLADGSLLTLGAKSDLRVVKVDLATQQSSIDLLYGRVRATVAHITKPGGNFTLRTPTAVVSLLGSAVAIDASMTATPASGDVRTLPLHEVPGVERTVVYALENVAAVRNIDAAVGGVLFLLPGESAVVERGKSPVRQAASIPPQDALPSAGACVQLVNLTRRIDDKVVNYLVYGVGVSTGDAFRVVLRNRTGCNLLVFIPGGTILKPTLYAGRPTQLVHSWGMPDIKDFQVMTTEGSTWELEPGEEEKSFLLRGFGLEMHKFAPTSQVEYKFVPGGQEKEEADNLRLLATATELYRSGQARSGSFGSDSLLQWSIWAKREKMDYRSFHKEFVEVVRKNYKAQNKKWDDTIEGQAGAMADALWSGVEKVLAQIGR